MRLKSGAFLAPVHNLSGNPTLQIRRDLQLAEHLDLTKDEPKAQCSLSKLPESSVQS